LENKNIVCPLYGSINIDIEYENVTDIEHKVAKGSFNYYKCRKCELVFIYPLLSIEALSSFYSNSYQCYSTIESKQKNKIKEFIKKYFGFLFLDLSIEKKFNKIFKLINKPMQDITILEYGCGSGSMILYLKENFKLKKEQILGVDFSVDAINICKKNGVNAKQAFNIKEINNTYDVIYAFQVLEHLKDFKEFIDNSYLKLKEGGVLYLQLPNFDSFGRKYFKEYWKGNDFPRHLYFFNKRSLHKLIEDKFEIIEFQTDRFYSSSIKLKKGLKLNEKHWTDKIIWSVLLRLYFGKFLGLFGIGDNIHLILRKK
jgi:2-polyprenyl-3-methyl-5-hydroxy-6-metoxy-1,4-benzoquinol methylase